MARVCGTSHDTLSVQWIPCIHDPYKQYALTLSILLGRCFLWKAETADPNVSTPTVKQALGTDFEMYVQTMVILVGVIIPSTSKQCMTSTCMHDLHSIIYQARV